MRLLAILLVFAISAVAQEARGTISGRVTDASGAVIQGATVQVLNTSTNVAAGLTTNEQGIFQALYLIPGTYRVTASGPGFKTFVRTGLELSVDGRLDIPIALTIGAVNETVTVTADTPMLETANATLGEVVDTKRIAELPIAHGNPFHLIQTAAGVNYLGDPAWDRAYEPAHAAVYSMGGARASRSEISMDGVSNTATTADGTVTAAYVPPADVVAEFKVQTATFDASVGQSEGGAVNVSLKSGGNKLHGTAYWAKMAPSWNANQFFANQIGAPRGDFNYNRWGASGNGPVYLPKLYDGRNRTFFTYGYEAIHEGRPRGSTLTVPTEAQRGGDFSALLAIGNNYQIYDPLTRRRAANGRFESSPLPGNIVPKSRIHPVAQGILKYFPLPTEAGTRDGRNNLPMPNEPEPITYYTHIGRVDHQINQRHRVFARGNVYKRGSHFNDWFHSEATGIWFQSLTRGAAADYVVMLSPTFIFNARYGFSRFIRTNDGSPASRGFDLTKLGFSAAYNNAIPEQVRRFPQLTIAGYTGTTNNSNWMPSETHSLPMNFDKMLGAHSLKFGGEFRAYRENQYNPGNISTGFFGFDAVYTRGPLDNSAAAPFGQGLAAMLLGIPSTAYVERRASFAEQSTAWSFFVQDDWKITSRLTINLGFRYELEGPLTERHNRSVRGFDPAAALPIEAAAAAAYARNPLPELSAAQFRVRGGVNFAGVNGNPRTLWARDTNNVMPRVGLAYRLGSKTVVRGGYGIFYGFLGTRRGDVIQSGFSERTNRMATLDDINFDTNLADPFPGGIREPLGPAGGAMTFAGQGISFFNTNPLISYMQRWQLGLQREMPHRIVFSATYLGNRGTHLETARNLNALPNSYFSQTGSRDQATIDFLTRNYPNPFLGLLPNTTRGTALMSRADLLRAYPQFVGVNTTTNEGYSWYHSAQFDFQKRFSHGWTLNASYTLSKMMEAVAFLNDADPRPHRVISDQDRPHRVSASMIFELPFGRGRALLSSTNRIANHIIGGWQYQAIWVFQSGQPLDFGNVLFNGDIKDIALGSGERSVERWFNTAAGFERDTRNALASNLRTFPLRFGGVRGSAANNWDMSMIKNAGLREGLRLQFRFEFLNATNHAWFAQPVTDPYNTAFGAITTQRGYSRRVQFGLKLLY